ncbi:hypothetical protein MATL_G00157050 [Megalops atlanticus]|uniref:Uncharacterized protein n=1 Tax=Megalops atlanticus TaxID=7932 RepID=A0A9D3PS80_MEGAT|nr:hypothetical protein MATL_G00157050 [Megalops atlanticus]
MNITNTVGIYMVLCCAVALLGTSQAKDNARSICNTTLKIPRNYQAGRGDVQEGNGNIHNRSLSAWTWRINYEENRIPKSISEAVCTFSYCTDPKSHPDKAELHDKLNSVPIHQERGDSVTRGPPTPEACYSSMAPVGAHVAGLAAASSFTPELLIASQVLLFILLVTLLIICTQCGRHSFQLEESSEKERKSSTLIRVVKLEEAAESRENPVINDIVKDEEVPSPTSENGSVQTPLEITAWRRHTGVPNHQGHTGDTPNTHVTPVITDPVSGDTTPPATDPPFVPLTFAPVVTPLMEQEVALQSAPPTVSAHPPDAEPGGADSPGQSQEVPDGNIPENPDGFWQRGPAHHTYESLEEVREAVSDLPVSPQEEEKKVEPDYQTWEELDYSLLPPPPLFDPQHEAEPEFPAPPTSGEGEGEDPQGVGLNAMYAQVSKKYKVPPPPSQPPPDDEEEVPPPPSQPPPDVEEEEPAPPIPERASELEENPSTAQRA